MVREVMDGGRWTLPGGWADVNMTVAESVIKEMREESGFDVTVRKLAAVWDPPARATQPPCSPAASSSSFATSSAARRRPARKRRRSAGSRGLRCRRNLSLGRVLPGQLQRMFDHARDATLPTDVE